MRTNVTYESKDCYVNPRQRTVLCKLKFSINLNKIPGISGLMHTNEFTKYLDYILDNGFAKYEYCGMYGKLIFAEEGFCKCADNDEFDPELGRKLALTRAQNDAFKTAKAFYMDVNGCLDEIYGEICDLVINCEDSATSCKKHTYELTGATYTNYNN